MIDISPDRASAQCRRAVRTWRRFLGRISRDGRTRLTRLRRGRPPRPKSRHVVPELDVSDLKAIISAVRLFGGPYGSVDAALTETAATSRRLRESELLALRWGDIDWVAGTVKVERAVRDGIISPPKHGSARHVRLAPHARKTLLRYRAGIERQGPDDLVFPDPEDGGFLDARPFRRRFRAALLRASIPALAFAHLPLAFRAPWWSRYL